MSRRGTDETIAQLSEEYPNVPWANLPPPEPNPEGQIPLLKFGKKKARRRGSRATYKGLRKPTWEYENNLREAEGHARYDDPRYMEDPQPDPWKGRIGLQSEAHQMEMNYSDPALYQGNLEGREHLHAQAWPIASAHTLRDLARAQRATAPPDDPNTPNFGASRDLQPMLPAKRLGELVEQATRGASGPSLEAHRAAAELAAAQTDKLLHEYGDLILAPFEATEEVYDDPEFKGTGEPSPDAPLHMVTYDYRAEAWQRTRMGWLPWLRRQLHLDDPRWQSPGPTMAARRMFTRLVRAWGNIDHHPNVLEPPGAQPGWIFPYMRSPNDFDPQYNHRLNYRRKVKKDRAANEGASTTPSERLRHRTHFELNERDPDTFFNYARNWHYSGRPWDAEGLAFLDTGSVQLKHPYNRQPGQFDFDREDYIDYDEDEGLCRKLCKAVFQENRHAVRGLLEEHGLAIANCKYNETFAPPDPPQDTSVDFQAISAWARHYANDVFIDHNEKKKIFRKKKGPPLVGDPHTGVTPIRMVIAAPSRDENKQLLRMLFRAGADPFETDRWGWTHVHCLASKSETRGISYNSRHDSQLAKMFLRRGVSANAADRDGHTPLHVAARAGAYEVGRVLLDAGADPNRQSVHKASPLHFSSLGMFGAPVAKMLLEAGANPNLVDHVKQTPLHSAASFCKPDVAQVLLEHGSVDMSKRDFRNRTALDIAEDGNCGAVAELIRQAVMQLRPNKAA